MPKPKHPKNFLIKRELNELKAHLVVDGIAFWIEHFKKARPKRYDYRSIHIGEIIEKQLYEAYNYYLYRMNVEYFEDRKVDGFDLDVIKMESKPRV